MNRHDLTVELTASFASRSATEWETILNEVDVPVARVLSVPDAFELDQVAHRGVLAEIGTVPGSHRPLRVVTAGFHVDGRSARPTTGPPALGEDAEQELTRLGYSSAEIVRLRQEGVV